MTRLRTGPLGARVHVTESEAHDTLAALPRAPQLVYIDPPFAAARDFHFKTKISDSDGERSYAALAYRDRWSEGLDGYLAFMTPILEGIRDVLDDEGSLLLHCDHRAAPYLAVLCDRLFGPGDRFAAKGPGFRNDLIWTYGLGGSSPRSYPKKHDTILWYTKGERWFFDPPMVPATSQRLKGKLKKAPDVIAIPTLNNMSLERTGYPTQKPLALLKLLVGAHTRPGDLVVDLFGGSGTTAAAALALGRDAHIGDRGAMALATMRWRFADDAVSVEGSVSDPPDGASVRRTASGVLLETPAPPIVIIAGERQGEQLEAEFTWRAPSLRHVEATPHPMLPVAPHYLVTDLLGRTYVLEAEPRRPTADD